MLILPYYPQLKGSVDYIFNKSSHQPAEKSLKIWVLDTKIFSLQTYAPQSIFGPYLNSKKLIGPQHYSKLKEKLLKFNLVLRLGEAHITPVLLFCRLWSEIR